jgi:hypothetical protein
MARGAAREAGATEGGAASGRAAQDGLHGRYHALHIQRLAEKVGGAPFSGGQGDGRVGIGGNHKDGGVRPQAAHARRHLQPVHARQAHVGNHQVKGGALHLQQTPLRPREPPGLRSAG